MAEWRWHFQIDKKYLVKVSWRIDGNALLSVNRKMIYESDSRTFSHSFLIEGKICEVRFDYQDVNSGYSKMSYWAPRLFVDGNEIQTG